MLTWVKLVIKIFPQIFGEFRLDGMNSRRSVNDREEDLVEWYANIIYFLLSKCVVEIFNDLTIIVCVTH